MSSLPHNTVVGGDVMQILPTWPENSIHCVVTSPPYWELRNYGVPGTEWPEVSFEPLPGLPPVTIPAMNCPLGQEPSPDAFIGHMVLLFREVRRVLRQDGTCWINIGDCYVGSGCGGDTGTSTLNSTTKPRDASKEGKSYRRDRMPREDNPHRGVSKLKLKDMVGIPWRLAFALQADGWYLRQDNIWAKPNPMPESVTDRCTKAHEYVFLLSKSQKYFYDALAIHESTTGNTHQRGSGVNPKSLTSEKGTKQNASFASAVNEIVSSRNKRSVWPIEYDEQACFQLLGDLLIEFENLGVSPSILQVAAERSWKRNPLAHLMAGLLTTVWNIPTAPYPDAHFATFPPKLAETAIRAGTSAHGCCAKCEAPYKRLVGTVKSSKTPSGWDTGPGSHREQTGRYKHAELHEQNGGRKMVENTARARAEGGEHDNPFPGKTTLGWAPTCNCGVEDRVPALVCDIFMGSGTTAEVAAKLGRYYIGTELNKDYLEMQRERLSLFTLLAAKEGA